MLYIWIAGDNKASAKNGWCFFYGMGVFSYVSGERGVPAGGAGEYPALLLDGADYYGGWGCVWIYPGGYC